MTLSKTTISPPKCESGVKRDRRFWVLMAVYLIVPSLLLWVVCPKLNYASGRYADGFRYSDYSFWISIIYLLILIVCLLYSLLKLACEIGPGGKYKGWAALLLVLIGSNYIAFEAGGPWAVLHANGFYDRMKAEADIEQIWNWYDELLAEEKGHSMVIEEGKWLSDEIKPEDWPQAVKNLDPRYCYIVRTDKCSFRLRIQWGGGLMGTWGMDCYRQGKATSIWQDDQSFSYRKEFAPGIDVFHER
ncbi:MAG: hypothetical protein JEZ07_14745 [Phycisphaerae bacterium]|nr:hypothetical protein [Phycisphaerae bacterium]